MKQVHIIFKRYLNEDDLSQRTIGGVQTYIFNLCKTIKEINAVPIIYQYASRSFETIYDGTKVIGVVANKKGFVDAAIEQIPKNEIVIFGSEEYAHKYEGISISIQHGIYWDMVTAWEHKRLKFLENVESINKHPWLVFLYQSYLASKIIKKVKSVNEIVCVDCNFINWYRTQQPHSNLRMSYIPNFSQIPNMINKNDECKVNIMFARRFMEFRGTRVFANSIEKLMNEKHNISVTLAGDGPDETWLREKLGKYPEVNFIKYQSDEAISIHSDKHIAVVPTTASEGTSLSLLEAMASHCAVVCTNVGGMTNIVLDGYNGKLINPDSEELYNALCELITNKEERERLADNAYYTAQNAFSIDQWKNKWKKVLRKYL